MPKHSCERIRQVQWQVQWHVKPVKLLCDMFGHVWTCLQKEDENVVPKKGMRTCLQKSSGRACDDLKCDIKMIQNVNLQNWVTRSEGVLERLLTILRNNQVARIHECFLCKRTIMFVDQGPCAFVCQEIMLYALLRLYLVTFPWVAFRHVAHPCSSCNILEHLLHISECAWCQACSRFLSQW